MAVDASVVIPTVGRPDLLAEVLRALEQQAGSFEVVVVCDGEHAQTRRMSEAWRSPFPLKWIFHPVNRGHSHARNLGADRSEGGILVFLDDDTVPAPGWLQAHLSHHANPHANRVVVGRLRHEYADSPRTDLERFMRGIADREQANLESSLARMDEDTTRELWAGLNASLSKTLFIASGGFDAALCHVEEDAELAARILNLGAEFVYEPDAMIYHRGTKDLVQLHMARASLFAKADLYRLLDKRQPAAKWPALASLIYGKGAQKLKNRLAWRQPRLAWAIGFLCRIGGEALGVEFLFRQWRDLEFMTRYWGQVKAEGLSIDDVRRLMEI